MKKMNNLVFVLLISCCSLTAYTQQKASEKPIADEINKVKQKQLMRNKMADQNSRQIQESNTSPMNSSQNDKKEQQKKPVTTSSAQPLKIPDRPRKQQNE